MSIKIISKDFDCEIIKNFTICKLICKIQVNNNELFSITISNNNCDGRFKICEFENDNIDSDILKLFENCDEFEYLIDFARESKLCFWSYYKDETFEKKYNAKFAGKKIKFNN